MANPKRNLKSPAFTFKSNHCEKLFWCSGGVCRSYRRPRKCEEWSNYCARGYAEIIRKNSDLARQPKGGLFQEQENRKRRNDQSTESDYVYHNTVFSLDWDKELKCFGQFHSGTKGKNKEISKLRMAATYRRKFRSKFIGNNKRNTESLHSAVWGTQWSDLWRERQWIKLSIVMTSIWNLWRGKNWRYEDRLRNLRMGEIIKSLKLHV